MSNLNQMGAKVLRNLDDNAANFFSLDADVIPSIQDGYNLIAALTESIETSSDVNFQNGLVFYDFTNYISNYLRLFAIYNNNTKRWLEPTSLIELYRYRDNWEATSGEPTHFVPIDYKTVAFFPVQAVATGTMTVLFKATAGILGANDSPILPSEHDEVLVEYATEDLLTQVQEWNKSATYAAIGDGMIEQIRKVLRERSSPNQIYFKQDNL